MKEGERSSERIMFNEMVKTVSFFRLYIYHTTSTVVPPIIGIYIQA